MCEDAYDEEREDWDGDGEGDDGAFVVTCLGWAGLEVGATAVGCGWEAVQSDHFWDCAWLLEGDGRVTRGGPGL